MGVSSHDLQLTLQDYKHVIGGFTLFAQLLVGGPRVQIAPSPAVAKSLDRDDRTM